MCYPVRPPFWDNLVLLPELTHTLAVLRFGGRKSGFLPLEGGFRGPESRGETVVIADAHRNSRIRKIHISFCETKTRERAGERFLFLIFLIYFRRLILPIAVTQSALKLCSMMPLPAEIGTFRFSHYGRLTPAYPEKYLYQLYYWVNRADFGSLTVRGYFDRLKVVLLLYLRV